MSVVGLFRNDNSQSEINCSHPYKPLLQRTVMAMIPQGKSLQDIGLRTFQIFMSRKCKSEPANNRPTTTSTNTSTCTYSQTCTFHATTISRAVQLSYATSNTAHSIVPRQALTLYMGHSRVTFSNLIHMYFPCVSLSQLGLQWIQAIVGVK